MVRPLLYLACVSLLIAGCNGAQGPPLNQGASAEHEQGSARLKLLHRPARRRNDWAVYYSTSGKQTQRLSKGPYPSEHSSRL